jgi:hypothetical protein
MPVIPLYQDGQTRVARRPTQGVTGNPAAGVRVSLGSIAGDLQAPLMSTAGVEAQGRAGAALGGAIAETGGLLGKLAMERFDAQNKIDVASAEMKMDEQAAKFEKWKTENTDPRDWEAGWTKHMEGFNPVDDKMSPNAAEVVTARYKLFQGQSSIKVATDATKQIFANARGLDITRIRIAEDQGNVDKVRRLATGNKYLNPGEDEAFIYGAEERRKDLEKKAIADKEKSTLEEVLTVATDNPDEAEKMVNSLPKDVSSFTRDRAMDIVRGQRRNQFLDAQTKVMDGLATAAADPENPKAAFTEADVDRVAPKGLRPSERAALKEIVSKNYSEAARTEASKPSEIRVRFGKLLDLAAKFDPAKTGGVESQETRDMFQYIMMESALLPESLRGEVTQPVSKLWRTGAPEIDTTIKGYINESLQDLYDNGGFGTTIREIPAADAYSKPTKAVDVEGQKKARAAFADARIAMSEWTKNNPKATRQDATAELLGIASKGMTKEDADKILKQANADTTSMPPGNFDWNGKALQLGAPPGAEGDTGPDGPDGSDFLPAPESSRITSYAYRNDETPDTNSSNGIGAWVPDDEQKKIERGEDSPYKLKEGDLAVSRDVEARMRRAGIRPGDDVELQLKDGSSVLTRWMDRTAATYDGKTVTGRFDFYRAGQRTKHQNEAAPVVGFRRA